jgi:hypothetical protein
MSSEGRTTEQEFLSSPGVPGNIVVPALETTIGSKTYLLRERMVPSPIRITLSFCCDAKFVLQPGSYALVIRARSPVS